ncbi:MAG TPA: phosphopantetheine-binding protein [Bryobacteraceae bacterium]|nr:phosphopantetheine-binding protein [Bryobacteraceae bacterium]
MSAVLNLAGSVRQLITEKLAVEIASDDTDLLTEGVLDSVTLVQLIMHMEQTFDIRVELADLEIDDLRSVHSIAALVGKLREAQCADDSEVARATANVM